ncbi:MAG: gliding motility-associated C-terminal domain-containing protein [Bacteroidia bacterium]|nr:gliding motility-associated C-terminal domain-containing protein [Bacteroidia bacterium]
MALKFILVLFSIVYFIIESQSQIFPNSDFELGLNTGCHCPTGYTCFNDAGRVVDGRHQLYVVGKLGCSWDTTSYANTLGAHSGVGYLYFYAGGDHITTSSMNFVGGEQIELCVWYCGPQIHGAPGQNTSDSHFSFGVDGNPVGPNQLVPVNTQWTQYCFVVTMTAGNHKFNILSGGWAQYAIWFDDFIIKEYCPTPTINFGIDTVLCQGETLNLNASIPNATYLWQDNSTNQTFLVSQSGTYWVEAINNCGTATDSIVVNYNPLPIIDLGNDTTLCQGETLTLDVTTPNATYQWLDNSTNPTFNVTQQGIYWVTATVNNCNKSDFINVTYNSLPSIELGNDTIICHDEALILNISSLNASYLWQDNSTDSTYTISQTGQYNVTVSNICGQVADSILVTKIPLLTINLPFDTTFCSNEPLVLNVTQQGSFPFNYHWQNGSNEPVLSITNPGDYTVTVSGSALCQTSHTTSVTELSFPILNFPRDTVICLGEQLTLNAYNQGSNYLWNDGSTLAQHIVQNNGIYTVTVSNFCGSTSDTTNLIVKDCIVYLDVPSAFSPNDDGNNDVLYAVGKNVDNIYFIIYDRWGNKVFESRSLSLGWNGTYNGNKLNANVFMYYITATSTADGSSIKKEGNISLIR